MSMLQKQLYRAVSKKEYEDIKSSRVFRAGKNTYEGKQFCYSAEEAKQFAEQIIVWDKQDAYIIEITIPEEVDKVFDHESVDPHLFSSSVTVQEEHLEELNKHFRDLKIVHEIKYIAD